MNTAPSHPLRTLVLSLLLIIMSGWLLHIGQDFIMPIVVALISVYVLVASADWMVRLPLVGRWPVWARRLLVLFGFLGVSLILVLIVISTTGQVIAAAPKYQANLTRLLTQTANLLHIDEQTSWQAIRAATVDRIELQTLLTNVLGSVGSIFGTTTLIAVYTAFLLGERGNFAHKLAVALPGKSADNTLHLIHDVNTRIGNYLAVKTWVNIILGIISYAILRAFGVDFALFWALIIAWLNYIPYIGSFIGVIFPVVLTLAQFGTLQITIMVALCLSVAQFFIGNFLEPRLIGRQVNLSPFVVLSALSLWGGLWGVVGAILAIPLTSMIAIILAAFPATRPFAVLLAEDVDALTPSPYHDPNETETLLMEDRRC